MVAKMKITRRFSLAKPNENKASFRASTFIFGTPNGKEISGADTQELQLYMLT